MQKNSEVGFNPAEVSQERFEKLFENKNVLQVVVDYCNEKGV